MRVTYDWADAGNGFQTLDIAGALCPRLGGGSERYPQLVQARFAAERPSADDRGDVFEVQGLKSRRVTLLPGQRMWIKAHVSQTMLDIARS